MLLKRNSAPEIFVIFLIYLHFFPPVFSPFNHARPFQAAAFRKSESLMASILSYLLNRQVMIVPGGDRHEPYIFPHCVRFFFPPYHTGNFFQNNDDR